MNFELKEIQKLVGIDAYRKGLYYPDSYVKYEGVIDKKGIHTHFFQVESERTYDFYKVKIEEKNKNIQSMSCTCAQYKTMKMCKHIAACIIRYKDDILTIDQEEKIVRISRGILEKFYEEPVSNQVRLKKQLQLEVELTFQNYFESSVELKFKIGENKLYNLNSKMMRFLRAYENKDETVEFGKNFIYDPSGYFFSKTDEAIIDYLVLLKDKNPYHNFQYISMHVSQIDTLIELLKNKSFVISGYGRIDTILKENPIKMSLSRENENFILKLEDQTVSFPSNEYQYAVRDRVLYQLPYKVSQILRMMKDQNIDELRFKEEDLEIFSKGILPIVKENINLDETVKDKIVLGVKPDIKIYLDLKDGIILCDAKLDYQGEEINYFDTTSKIIRDEVVEKEMIEDLLQYGFQIDDKKIYMEDMDTIGEFLEDNLIELAKKYEVFTTDKMKETKVIKENSIRSSFSIGQDNIMKYEFDLGNIKNDEIVDILETMKSKRKYYRLKSGDLINLNENEDLRQLENLVDDMEISKKDLKNGNGTIPKYRAIYLDSIKKDKYHIIKTNNLFDELIEKFNSYKDANIDLSAKDKKILRDYQEIGVKWLYNIYKCGFGGILADEMGLGKSIQLIYLIKQILKEKKDAKILIVAPTSLIYNWKNEFDKFGKEIHYKVFAENRAVRKQELENIEDINVLITTYGLVRQDQEKYLEINFEIVAIDEAQNIKNINAQMTKIIKQLHANTKFALTGTPLENSVLELWSIFDFIMPGYLANNVNFQRKYNIKDVNEESLNVLDNLNKQIKPFILRRKKKDVVKELPDKIENNIYIDLNKEQKKLYVAQLEKTQKELENILASDGFQKGSFKILQLLTKLRQLCIDPRILYENYKGGSAKIESLIELVQGIIENGHKILLFTSYKMALDIVNKEFTNHNISTYVIDGSVSSKKRMELVDKFNQDDTNVFLITLKAGGTGLNLTSADVVIHLDLWWNPQAENQATDRAHRIGQKNTVEVIKLICKGTIEERILELQNKKKVLSDKLIEGEDRDQNIISKLTEKDIKKLISLDNSDES